MSVINDNHIRCHDNERDALLQFKRGIRVDSCGLLDSWRHGHDCCQWRGIHCNNHSGHVTVLNIPGSAFYETCLEVDMASNGGEPGESSRAHHNVSDDDHEEDEMNIVRPDLPRLVPGEFWFNEGSVVEDVGKAIKGYFPEFKAKWKHTDNETIKHWWNVFKAKYGYHKHHEAMVKEAWEAKAKDRFRDYIYRAGHNVPSWFEDPVKEQFEEYKKSEDYLKKSAQGKKNRYSQGEDGKPAGTHTMGRTNMLNLMNKMVEESSGVLPTAPELMMRSKQSKKKDGGFVSKKSLKVAETFKSKKLELSQPGENAQASLPHDNDIYLKTVGGADKKGRVFGLGNATSLVFNHVPGIKKKGKRNMFTPILSTLSSENVKLRQSEAELRSRLAAVEEREKLRDEREKKKENEDAERKKQMDLWFSYYPPPPNCNLGGFGTNQDPRPDQGGNDTYFSTET